ncbi:MAG: DUF167 domain-containing protein [Elusimicrobia bacterium]|nr:DUF167 domain-containing protein [Elusimicrobiota bacterium]
MTAALFRVKVHAGDKHDLLVSASANAFAVWVRAKPEQGRANQAVLALLARHLGVNPKRLRIIKGSTSPNKIVALLGGS